MSPLGVPRGYSYDSAMPFRYPCYHSMSAIGQLIGLFNGWRGRANSQIAISRWRWFRSAVRAKY